MAWQECASVFFFFGGGGFHDHHRLRVVDLLRLYERPFVRLRFGSSLHL
jgi:hypothetical protein